MGFRVVLGCRLCSLGFRAFPHGSMILPLAYSVCCKSKCSNEVFAQVFISEALLILMIPCGMKKIGLCQDMRASLRIGGLRC